MTFWMRRPVWKNEQGILLFLLTSFAFYFGLQPVIHSLGLHNNSNWEMPLLYLVPLGVTLLLTTLFDRMPIAWSGLGFHRRMPREIFLGTALGLSMALLAWIPLALAGSVKFAWSGSLTTTLIWTLVLLSNAAGEEILFRGYLFDRSVEIFGQTIGTLLLSGLFAAAHIGGAGLTSIGGMNIVLAGILFSACRLLTGSLWMSIGVHASWNIALALLFGVPMSGMNIEGSIFHTTLIGPDSITGGAFGPEGGIITTAVLLIAGIALFKLPGLQFSPFTFARVFWGLYRQKNAQISAGDSPATGIRS